jgi:hypothetical protein
LGCVWRIGWCRAGSAYHVCAAPAEYSTRPHCSTALYSAFYTVPYTVTNSSPRCFTALCCAVQRLTVRYCPLRRVQCFTLLHSAMHALHSAGRISQCTVQKAPRDHNKRTKSCAHAHSGHGPAWNHREPIAQPIAQSDPSGRSGARPVQMSAHLEASMQCRHAPQPPRLPRCLRPRGSAAISLSSESLQRISPANLSSNLSLQRISPANLSSKSLPIKPLPNQSLPPNRFPQPPTILSPTILAGRSLPSQPRSPGRLLRRRGAPAQPEAGAAARSWACHSPKFDHGEQRASCTQRSKARATPWLVALGHPSHRGS